MIIFSPLFVLICQNWWSFLILLFSKIGTGLIQSRTCLYCFYTRILRGWSVNITQSYWCSLGHSRLEVFGLLNDSILIAQFKDVFFQTNKKKPNLHSLITCSLDCRFFNSSYWVKALLTDFILVTQFKDESFQNKTKKLK